MNNHLTSRYNFIKTLTFQSQDFPNSVHDNQGHGFCDPQIFFEEKIFFYSSLFGGKNFFKVFLARPKS